MSNIETIGSFIIDHDSNLTKVKINRYLDTLFDYDDEIDFDQLMERLDLIAKDLHTSKENLSFRISGGYNVRLEISAWRKVTKGEWSEIEDLRSKKKEQAAKLAKKKYEEFLKLEKVYLKEKERWDVNGIPQ